jgi:hypothetical protein
MANIKVLTGKKIVHTEEKNKEKAKSSSYKSTEREVLKYMDADKGPSNSKKVLTDIPIDLIRDRDVNKFRMSGIKELAEEFEKNGMWVPIIVVPDKEGKGYVISSGHRRFHAYSYLYEKYKKEHPGEENPYYKIVCQIMSGLSDEEEEEIYLKSNSFSRNTTMLEVVANLNPEKMDFDNPNFKEEYLTYMYGDGAYEKYLNGEIKDKCNFNSLSAYCYRKIKDLFSDVECNEESVKRYLRVLKKSSDIVLKKFFADEIGMRQLLEISSTFSIDEQNVIYNSEDPDAKKKEILARHKKKEKKERKEDPDVNLKHLSKEINKFTKPIMMLCSELDSIEENETNQAELNRIRKLKAAISEYLNQA